MDDQSQLLAQEFEAELRREVESVRGEMGQIRELVQDAILKLTGSFTGLREQSDQQHQLVSGLVSTLDKADKADQADGEEGTSSAVNVRQFVGETDQILRTFIDHIVLVSRQSMEMVHRIDELAAQMNQVGSLLKDINAIAELTNVLSLNARIVAARAGQSGMAFSVVATEVRKLAQSSHEFSDKIGVVVGNAQKNIKSVQNVIKVMASKDMNFAIEAKGRVDEMITEVSDIDRYTSETIGKVSTMAGEIAEQVGLAIMSLQFEDMVTQLTQSMERKFAVLEQLSTPLTQGLMGGAGLSEAERLARMRTLLAQQQERFDEVDRKVVQQDSMDEGDIELF